MELRGRAQAMDALASSLRSTAAVYQRVAELITHIVAAHAAALERLVELADDPGVLERDPELAEILWVHRPDGPDLGEGAGTGADPESVDRYGNRIEALLAAIEQSATPPIAATAGQLVAEVGDLYGEALARATELLHESGQGDAIRAALTDDLVASLLVVHDLHPHDLRERVARCLTDLAVDLPEHGGLVEFHGVDDDGMVHVEINGGSEIHRWRTRLAVERAIDKAAPDHGGIDVKGARIEPEPAQLTTFVQIDTARRKPTTRSPRQWIDVPRLGDLSDGGVQRVETGGVALVACNVGGDLYVALDPFDSATAGTGTESNGVRLVARQPPTVESADGTRLVLDSPLPVQRTDDTVEVMVP